MKTITILIRKKKGGGEAKTKCQEGNEATVMVVGRKEGGACNKRRAHEPQKTPTAEDKMHLQNA